MRKVYNFLSAKKITLLLITGLIFTSGFTKVNAQANAGIYDSYVKISGQKYFLGYSSTPPSVLTNKINQLNEPAFSGVNFGTFDPNATLNLNGVLAYTWKPTSGNAGNICGIQHFYYSIVQNSSTVSSSSFTGYSQNSVGNIGSYFCQDWYDTSKNINVLSGLDPGTYTLQVYINITGSLSGNDCNSQINADGLPGTGGAYYNATFTIKGAKCPPTAPTGTELITNGNFDNGNTGFTTGYTLKTSYSGNSLPGQYVVDNAAIMAQWNSSFIISGDASGNVNGNFMGVDGSNGPNVWSETVTVIPNTIYIFSFYACGFNGSAPAQLYFYANGTAFGGSTSTPLANKWSKYTKSWCSGSSTSVTISIKDNETANIGNDFGLDSISLRSSNGYTNISAGKDTTVCSGNPVLLNPTNGACTYTWVPATGLSNDSIATPVATPTVTTTYTLYAVVPGCTEVTDTSKVVVAISAGGGGTLTVTANPTTVCSGDPATLTIASGSGSYTWSSSAGAVSGTGSSIVVNPTVTTTYTATEPGGSCAASGHVTLTVANATVGGSVTALRDTICSGTTGSLTLSGNSSDSLRWQSSINGTDYSNIGGQAAADTNKYRTTPLTETTWFRVNVGNGGCTALSDVVTLTVPPALTATFTYTLVTKTATFNSNGSIGNISSYFWDFGDGANSNEKNPTHTYHTQDSSYNACLTIYDGSNCSYTFCRLISWTGINEVNAGNYSIYPNPITSQLTISATANNQPVQSVAMYDVLGREIINSNFSNSSNTTLQLDVTPLAKGMYYVVIKTADANYMQKVVKQ